MDLKTEFPTRDQFLSTLNKSEEVKKLEETLLEFLLFPPEGASSGTTFYTKAKIPQLKDLIKTLQERGFEVVTRSLHDGSSILQLFWHDAS